ncbi:MAG: ATP-binding cassette domain-containing protein [Prevotellaceae bacterium]|jgi:D-methionine transport system ATP-binding protein|nr:ATP-binding cassette domain-containing protein [Prevotellaceae bacterium]
MIELKNITKEFIGKERITTALSDVTLSVAEGKIMGVIGESGAGKSTLIRCVNLLERPTAGEIIVDKQNLMQLSSYELMKARRNTGMIFQHFNLLASRNVFNNIAFPLELNHTPRRNIEQRVSELLKLVGLENKAYDYPAKLSGGQKQRVAIARALADNPKVLLCDEATSALDPATTVAILSLLKEINKKLNITILLITHEMNVVKTICDEVAVLNDGKLIEKGSVTEIFSNPKNELTKHFVSSAISIQIPVEYRERLSHTPVNGKHLLAMLKISGQCNINSLFCEMEKNCETGADIICAQIDYIEGVKVGTMLVELKNNKSLNGNESNESDNESNDSEIQAVEFLKNKNIDTKILGYV